MLKLVIHTTINIDLTKNFVHYAEVYVKKSKTSITSELSLHLLDYNSKSIWIMVKITN